MIVCEKCKHESDGQFDRLFGGLGRCPWCGESFSPHQFTEAEVLSASAVTKMVNGFWLCFIGLALTVITISSAYSSPTGGVFIIAWGPVIFGALLFFRGLYQSNKSKSLTDPSK